MTISEIKYNPVHERIKLLSRQIVLGNLLPVTSIDKAVEEMKDTAERRENENQGTSLSSAYTSKYNK
jgi:hypothetical protein